MIETLGHELSGLPSYGLQGCTLYRRSYQLLAGRRPRARRGHWEPIGYIGADAAHMLRTARPEQLQWQVRAVALGAGLMCETIDACGTPQFERGAS